MHPAVTATRALSSVPEGHNEKMMFALGLSMGLRTGAEVKDVLDKNELEHLAAGFTAHMTGSLGEEGELAVLQEVGPALNDEMIKRVNEKAEANKTIGEMFIQVRCVWCVCMYMCVCGC
jgi:hypothetical protein